MADGLATWLRRRHPVTRYIGFELEVNQALAAGSDWRRVGEALAASLAEALDPRSSRSKGAARRGRPGGPGAPR